MVKLLKTIVDHAFWPLIVGYCLYLGLQTYFYFTGLKNVYDKDLYNQLFLKKIGIVAFIMGTGIIFRILGKEKVSNIVLGVPGVIILVPFIIIMLTWVYLAIVLQLFGKN